jgi:hypothetical protein
VQVPEVEADELACKPDTNAPRPAIVHVVTSAARAPTASLTRWLRHPCPRHHHEQGGQDEGAGEEQATAAPLVPGAEDVPRRETAVLYACHNKGSTAVTWGLS